MEDFLFKKLIVWQKAMEFSKAAYAIVNTLPTEERYALSDQLRRAIISVPSNIAEGNGRGSSKDYAHFLAIARGSLFEVLTQLELAQILGYISNYDSIVPLAAEISRMLTTMLQKFGTVQQKT